MPKHTLTLPSCTKTICHLEQFIGVVAQKYKIGNDKFPDILISLTEAVNNAIIHGNKEDRAKQVKIDLDKTPLGFSFTVTDEGTGFDPINVPDPTAPENIGCCGGRGVFLIKQLADHVVYHDKGRRVEIRFDV